MTKYNIINGNIFHAEYDTQKEIAMTFFRMAEYYESPHKSIFRKVFTFEQFLDCYVDDDGFFPYLEAWPAFNIPGKYVEEFFEKFGYTYDITERERRLYWLIKQNMGYTDYYVISNLKHNTEDYEHELCHALYYTNPEYKAKVNELIKQMPIADTAMLSQILIEMEYPDNDEIMMDELNAYLSTNSIETWEREDYFDLSYGQVEHLVGPFVEAFQEMKKQTIVTKILD